MLQFLSKLVKGAYAHCIARREPRRLPTCLLVVPAALLFIVKLKLSPGYFGRLNDADDCCCFRSAQEDRFSLVEVDRAGHADSVLNLPMQAHKEPSVL